MSGTYAWTSRLFLWIYHHLSAKKQGFAQHTPREALENAVDA